MIIPRIMRDEYTEVSNKAHLRSLLSIRNSAYPEFCGGSSEINTRNQWLYITLLITESFKHSLPLAFGHGYSTYAHNAYRNNA
jgi:hypothetical protein